MIDLRSDTVTKPTPGMLAAMMGAAVGDDVYGEDATVNALEEHVANYLGLEAAVFVPSGTMSNQIAVRLHCQPGDELLIEETSHIYVWEAGGPAVHSGATCRTFRGENGLLSVDQLQDNIRPDDPHSVRTRLVCIEQTHNRGGGTVYPLETIAAISKWARANQLAMHLDGARLWNAVVASGVSAKECCRHFDTVSVCFSKGLGAPIGSALAGPRDLMAKARRTRKLFGGAMRQVGYIAAACRYAMDHHIDRLAEDHANAKLIADAVRSVKHFKLTPAKVETNLVWFDVDPAFGTGRDVVVKMKEKGILVSALGRQTVRMCTHVDASSKDCETASAAIHKLFG
jgi:threonine aldolase